MATSFDQITQRVKQQLLGYTRNQEKLTYLTSDMTATDVMLNVDIDTARAVSRGVLEIDDELILVKGVDVGSGNVQVFGGLKGRGAEGSTASAHSMDSIIISDPRYPRIRIKEAINETISAIYPDIWIFGETEFPYIAARLEYPIPAEAEDVYKVVWNTIGPSGMWMASQRYRFNPQASTTPGQTFPTPTPTGKSIQILDYGITPGRNVRVTYVAPPKVMVNGSDDFVTTTGLEERMLDLIVYGACWRLLPGWEAGRLQQSSIESTERAPLVPTGAANNASQYYLGLYQRRLNEERDRLLDLYPNYQTFSS